MSPPSIPLVDLSAEATGLWPETQAAVERVLRSGHFIGGPEVEAFEAEMAAYAGIPHAVALNSGTDALVIALRAFGIGAGDEVVTTPFTFFATAEAVSHVGATPVFVDIEPDSYNFAPAGLAAAVTARTKAIIAVHLFGLSADMSAVRTVADRHGLKIIEDVAQALGGTYLGRKLGSLGDAAALSFFPSKTLGACGDGGMLLTGDAAVAAEARMLRSHGSKRKYYNEAIGYNSRLDAVQAAILRLKLPHLDRWNAARGKLAQRYHAAFAPLPQVTLPTSASDCLHTYYAYTVRIGGKRRDAVRDALARQGIETMIYYPLALTQLPVYKHLRAHCPIAEAATAEVLTLPLWPQMPPATQDRVIEAVRGALLSEST